MSAGACDRCRGLLLADAAAARGADTAAHLAACPECRAFAEALGEGAAAWLAEDASAFGDGVLARTSAADALVAELRELADMDPGPAFTARVLAHTSQRPAPERWWAGWLAAWRALARRPRFAWEVAYVATLCWVLVLGNPVGAVEWGAQQVNTIARHRIVPAASTLVQDLEAWRAAFASDARGEPPASGAAAAQEPRGAFEAAWQSASDWVGASFAQVLDALLGVWEQIAALFREPPAAGQPPPATEPRSDTARSPQ